jgi:hypothetical protein
LFTVFVVVLLAAFCWGCYRTVPVEKSSPLSRRQEGRRAASQALIAPRRVTAAEDQHLSGRLYFVDLAAGPLPALAKVLDEVFQAFLGIARVRADIQAFPQHIINFGFGGHHHDSILLLVP